jgi:allantoin racemase
MKLLVINPNSDARLTEALAGFAAEAVPDADIVAVTAPFGPEYIRSPEDGEAALRAIAALLDDLPADIDAAMIASSSDTGLDLAREKLAVPVTAMTEAAMAEATACAPRFGCIGFQVWGGTLMRELAEKYGYAGRYVGTWTAALSVGGPSPAPDVLVAVVVQSGRLAIDRGGVGALIVGGAAMCPYVDELTEELGIPVIDGVRAAARRARRLAAL